MNRRQYKEYVKIMKYPLIERKEMAKTAQGEIQLILSYDPSFDVIYSLLKNPNLSPASLLNIVKKRNITSDILEAVSQNKTWVAQYEIKRELIRNPKTPLYISLKLLRFMFRKDLQEIARNVGVSQVIRHAALLILKTMLSDLLPGEKISLAKEAVGPILGLLLQDKNQAVIHALLQNSRLRENDVVLLSNRKDLNAELIVEIYNSRWKSRYHIKIAIANNPNTPLEILKKIIPTLLQQDILVIIQNPLLAVPVRVFAREAFKIKLFSLPHDQLIRVAQTASRQIVNILIENEDLAILRMLEKNPNLGEGHVVSLATRTFSNDLLFYLALESKWKKSFKLKEALLQNPHLPEELISLVDTD